MAKKIKARAGEDLCSVRLKLLSLTFSYIIQFLRYCLVDEPPRQTFIGKCHTFKRNCEEIIYLSTDTHTSKRLVLQIHNPHFPHHRQGCILQLFDYDKTKPNEWEEECPECYEAVKLCLMAKTQDIWMEIAGALKGVFYEWTFILKKEKKEKNRVSKKLSFCVSISRL